MSEDQKQVQPLDADRSAVYTKEIEPLIHAMREKCEQLGFNMIALVEVCHVIVGEDEMAVTIQGGSLFVSEESPAFAAIRLIAEGKPGAAALSLLSIGRIEAALEELPVGGTTH